MGILRAVTLCNRVAMSRGTKLGHPSFAEL